MSLFGFLLAGSKFEKKQSLRLCLVTSQSMFEIFLQLICKFNFINFNPNIHYKNILLYDILKMFNLIDMSKLLSTSW